MNVDVNSPTISYDESKALANHADPAVRAALARRPDIRPEILYFLAEDDDAEVRRAIAGNAGAPGQTNLLLAQDTDVGVRSGLAAKIAAVAPDLTAQQRSKVREQTYAALEMLAEDQIQVVREALAEALKDIPDAPPDIVKTLARDLVIEVSGPVLEHSPVLTDADLVEIIEDSPIDGALNAIARRDALEEMVADAIVATDDVSAITDLLDNDSAQIREQTLDDLIDKAAGVELWQKPLVARSRLPSGAAGRMARYLADNLMSELQQRADLDPDALAQVKSAMAERFGDGPADLDMDLSNAAAPAQDFLTVEPPMDMVMRLYNARKLDSKMVEKAMSSSDHGFVFAALLVRAGVDVNVGRKMFREKNPKGIVALCWKANLPISLCIQVQQRLGRLPPGQIMMPAEGGQYPMTDDELEWQLEFFRDLVQKAGS